MSPTSYQTAPPRISKMRDYRERHIGKQRIKKPTDYAISYNARLAIFYDEYLQTISMFRYQSGGQMQGRICGKPPMHFQLKQTYLTRKPPFHRLSASTRRLLTNNGGEQLEYWSVRSRYLGLWIRIQRAND